MITAYDSLLLLILEQVYPFVGTGAAVQVQPKANAKVQFLLLGVLRTVFVIQDSVMSRTVHKTDGHESPLVSILVSPVALYLTSLERRLETLIRVSTRKHTGVPMFSKISKFIL